MKYIIIGPHCSGKQRIAEDLKNLGHKVGNIFRSVEELKPSHYSLSNVYYEFQDIEKIFESQAYLFIKQCVKNSVSYFEGLSSYDFENNDVFIMSPDQFIEVPEFTGDVCFVWLDNSQGIRYSLHANEHRKYEFFEQEKIESGNLKDFTERIYKYPVLYFNNEVPERVSAIIHSLLVNPELFDVIIKRFN